MPECDSEQPAHCEHYDIEQTDQEASFDDIRLLPDAFLRVTGKCYEKPTHICINRDELGDDDSYYCERHALEHYTNSTANGYDTIILPI